MASGDMAEDRGGEVSGHRGVFDSEGFPGDYTGILDRLTGRLADAERAAAQHRADLSTAETTADGLVAEIEELNLHVLGLLVERFNRLAGEADADVAALLAPVITVAARVNGLTPGQAAVEARDI